MTPRFFWVTVVILLGYITAIKCAEYLQPKFITIIDSDCHDHTTGKWVKIETGKKGK
jgi:hypothetical protein